MLPWTKTPTSIRVTRLVAVVIAITVVIIFFFRPKVKSVEPLRLPPIPPPAASNTNDSSATNSPGEGADKASPSP
jgi:hypothetical protein